jgi:hypothetical protein
LIKAEHFFLNGRVTRSGSGRAGNPDGIKARSEIGLEMAPSFTHPTLNSISHDRIATSFGDNHGHAPSGPRKTAPVEFEWDATFDSSLTANG